jgi:Cys-tRNA(Pro)/Cys-tRNA(Cys) deacylase
MNVDDRPSSLDQENTQKPLKDTAATAMLAEAGLPYALHAVIPEVTRPSSGAAAMSAGDKAEYLGFDTRRLFKTVIVAVGTDLVSATLPASADLELQSLAAAVGADHAELANPSVAEHASGYDTQFTSPLGLATSLPPIIDVSAMAYPSILIDSGVAGLILEVIPRHLLNVLEARTAPITTG